MGWRDLPAAQRDSNLHFELRPRRSWCSAMKGLLWALEQTEPWDTELKRLKAMSCPPWSPPLGTSGHLLQQLCNTFSLCFLHNPCLKKRLSQILEVIPGLLHTEWSEEVKRCKHFSKVTGLQQLHENKVQAKPIGMAGSSFHPVQAYQPPDVLLLSSCCL